MSRTQTHSLLKTCQILCFWIRHFRMWRKTDNRRRKSLQVLLNKRNLWERLLPGLRRRLMHHWWWSKYFHRSCRECPATSCQDQA
ncbi:hypothetical protein PVAP13_5NG222262 [Panicum virgatum]|uniref:Uncharacterized protein n=1 Tax=Panicum virgatum TaxID=38727 RepID=A0A8T0RUJ8_PANVG|nr:hypothetical protein PVAP13_5NG222262 [Panicum virgatum]